MIMKANMKKVRCGGCGNSEVKLYTNDEGEISAVCVSCRSETNLVVDPKIRFDWGDKGDGVLCVF